MRGNENLVTFVQDLFILRADDCVVNSDSGEGAIRNLPILTLRLGARWPSNESPNLLFLLGDRGQFLE